MNGSNQESRVNALCRFLMARGPSSAKDSMSHLGISQPAFSRLVRDAKGRVQSFGRGRSTLYVCTRHVRDVGYRIPLFKINTSGDCEPLGELIAFYPRGYCFIAGNGDVGMYDGIPFFLSDSRPQGFIGRSFSKRNPDLALPDRLTDWSEDDFMTALAKRSDDTPGNLIIGRESFERYHKALVSASLPIPLTEKAVKYAEIASAALEGSLPGSSAAGEQPKFTAFVEGPNGAKHVLVKFSPNIDGFNGRRWVDLLLSESIALEILSETSVPASKACLVQGTERVFLEVTRYDRSGARGRAGVISLGALDDEWFGQRDDWVSASIRFNEIGAISREDASAIRFLYSFGGLIANSDRHFGNLSLFWEYGAKQVRLAPVYDMLPMLYAPVEGQRVEREFRIEPPKPDAATEWQAALPLAIKFWDRVSADSRVSEEFRDIATGNGKVSREYWHNRVNMSA